MDRGAAHRVANYPLIALASQSEEAVLANWRSFAWLMSLGATGCAIVSLVAAGSSGTANPQKHTKYSPRRKPKSGARRTSPRPLRR